MVDRAWELMPSRRPSVRSISPRISQAETQRRAALGVLAFVGIILVLGLIVMLLPRGGERSPAQVAEGDSSLSVATDRAQRAASIAVTDPGAATALYREAYAEITRARSSGVRATALDQLETQVRAGLDSLYGARIPASVESHGHVPGRQRPDRVDARSHRRTTPRTTSIEPRRRSIASTWAAATMSRS